MRNIKLDTILIFSLLIPFIMTFRLSPGNTPYWLFGLIFLGLLSYVILDTDIIKIRDNSRFIFKHALLWILIVLTIGSAYYSAIIVRHQTSPIYNTHDIVVQQESAIRFLLHGKNPYAATYFGTPLEKWPYSDTEINPALYHFVMQPLYLIFPIPFYFLFTRTIGFFDARIPLVFLFFALLVMASRLIKDQQKKLEFMVLLAFNPGVLGYFLEGRDDIFMFAFLFASLFLLFKKKYLWSGVVLALAFAVKQSVWPIFPFYVAFLYFKNKNFKKTVLEIIPFGLMFCAIVAPFIFWDYRAFLDSTVLYLSGNTAHSYPVSGYGLGAFLNQIGAVKDVHSYYPFWIWQVILGLPLIAVLILWQKRNNTVPRLIISYGIFLFVFWYLSRYFNNSHLGYLSLVFITSYFWPQKQVEHKFNSVQKDK